MKLAAEIVLGLIAASVILYVCVCAGEFYLPTWIMDYRIRGFKKSLAEGRDVINKLGLSIAELQGKLALDPTKYESFKPLLASLEAHQTGLQKSTDRFQQRLEYITALVQDVKSITHKNYTQEEVDSIILKLTEPGALVEASAKMDRFLKELNGDK